MKRKILFGFLLFLLIVIPLNVIAASSATLSLACNTSVKKSAVVTCKVKGNITSGTIESISGDANGGTYFVSTTSFSNSNPTGFTGSSVDVATFTLTAKNVAGNAEISLENLVVTDTNGDPVTLSSTTVKTNVTILDDEKSLTNILIDGTAVPSFNSATKNYTFSMDKEQIAITVQKPASVKSVTGTGTKKLVCGANKINLVVKAQDDTTTTYVLNITRNCSNDVTLKNITLSAGSLVPGFSKDVKKYTVAVTNDIDKITIAAIKNDEKQTITGAVTDAALKSGENTFTISVVAENGSKDTFTIVVTREPKEGELPAGTIATLSLSAGKLEFNPYVYEYSTKVLYEVTNITVDAKSGNDTGKVTVVGGTNLVVGENTITVTITDGDIKKDYKIIVTRLEEGVPLGDNANIKKLTVKGYDLNFLPDVLEYKLKIGKETELDLTVLLEEPEYADYVISGNRNLKDGSEITIVVTSVDGTTKVYKIKIEKSSSNLILFASIGAVIIAVALVIVLVMKNKKDPDKVKTKRVKDKKGTKETTDEVAKEEVKVEEVKATTPEKDETLVIGEVKEELKAPEEVKAVVEEKEKIKVQTLDEVESLDDEPKVVAKEDAEIPEKSTEIETKICSICGHRVSVGAKTCPYCKRTW